MQMWNDLKHLLQVKVVTIDLKGIEQATLADREREVLSESLERAYDQSEALLTPQIIQMIADEDTQEQKE